MAEKKHIAYLDELRLLACLSVIYMHTAAGPLRMGITRGWHVMNLLTSLCFTAVPLFVMMSGFLLLSDPKTRDYGYVLRKRFPRLAVPLAGWTVVAILWKMISGGITDPTYFLDSLISALAQPAWIHFWYLYTMIPIVLLSPIFYCGLQGLDKKGHRVVFSCIAGMLLLVTCRNFVPEGWKRLLELSLVNQLRLFDGYLAIFLLGYYLGNLKKQIPNALLLAAAAVLWGIITFGTYRLSAEAGAYVQTFQGQDDAFEVLFAACLFLLAKQNRNRVHRLLTGAGIVPLLFSVYFMHNILLDMMYRVVLVTRLGDTLAVAAANFVICCLVMKTVATVKPICYLATGISYATACKTCNWIHSFRLLKAFLTEKRAVSQK